MNEPLRRLAASQAPLIGPTWRLSVLVLYVLLFSLGFLGFPALPVSAAAPAEVFDPERLAGVWIRTQRSEDDALRRTAIEEITQPMSLVVRGLARAVMMRSIRPAERYVIQPAEIGLSIRSDDEAPVTALLNGQLDHDPDAKVRSRPLTDGFVQTWRQGPEQEGQEGGNHGTTTWRLDANDGLLRVTVTVHDARFPHPLVYTTTYRRSEGTDSDRAGLAPDAR